MADRDIQKGAQQAVEKDPQQDPQKERALSAALAQIERQFGKGSMMRLGDQELVAIPSIPT
ncbi:MAG: DNA recombination/repair protein RecA, partial [Gammaproteobacteria bacterium]|nr:DNA recombination/repair protein RecA [Gammaproteobacteria bacterium]